MPVLLRLLPLLFLLSTAACREQPANSTAMKLRILKQQFLEKVPSGSALLTTPDHVYIISDNAPALFRLPHDLSPAGLLRIPLRAYDSSRYLLTKAEKPDYEAAVLAAIDGAETIVAFGSGSLSPQRDSILLAPLNRPTEQSVVPAGAFYAHLRRAAGIAPADFNLEAAAIAGDRLVLCNRGTNAVVQLSLQEFSRWLAAPDSQPLPALRADTVSLPAIGGRVSGLSGLAALPDGSLLFCASVEATQDWVSDGEVLGSFAGRMKIGADGRPEVTAAVLLADGQGAPLKEKLESVALVEQLDGQSWRILAVSDNDNGSSTLYELVLEGKNPDRD